MDFDYCNNPRKPLLFSELFKPHGSPNPESSKLEPSSSSSSSTHFLSSFDSASSGFSTPLGSELGSSESDHSDFTAELTRQMAECMLQEDDPEDNSVADYVSDQVINPVKSNAGENYAHSGGLYSGPVCSDDRMPLQTQIYHGKNQLPVSKESSLCWGRRVKGADVAQQKQIQKTEQPFMRYRGIPNEYSGSGMKAVFLGGSGPNIGPPGTGVFLPRDPSKLKNKSGCSTVLIPTRVLQLLELHFSRIQDSPGPPLCADSLLQDEESLKSNGSHNGSWDEHIKTLHVDSDETQLPQEWTY